MSNDLGACSSSLPPCIATRFRVEGFRVRPKGSSPYNMTIMVSCPTSGVVTALKSGTGKAQETQNRTAGALWLGFRV